MKKRVALFFAFCFCSAAMAQSPIGFESARAGNGPSPKASDEVTVHYRGYLQNGVVFDESYRSGKPARFRLNEVIPCWTEGVARMKAGGKARLTCPAETAYGQAGVPGSIPPGATLVFDVELLSIAP